MEGTGEAANVHSPQAESCGQTSAAPRGEDIKVGRWVQRLPRGVDKCNWLTLCFHAFLLLVLLLGAACVVSCDEFHCAISISLPF